MRLILPNGTKLELDRELSNEDKRSKVDEILAEWNWYFTKYRNNKTAICLEILSNFLCYEKKEEQLTEGEENDAKEEV
jgi:hypothetical protein